MPTPGMQEYLDKKYKILQQNADATTTRANAVAQNVGQQQALQAQANQAATDRARIAAQNQAMIAGMNNQSAQDVAGINARSRLDVANVGETGASYRAGLTTGTQRDIAGMNDAIKREQLFQQNEQFGKQYGLDSAKAQESSIQNRAILGVPEFGNPALNPRTGMLQSTVKRPALTGLAPSPLGRLNGQSGIGMESDDTLRKLRDQLSNGQ